MGDGDRNAYETIVYEGYGPAGVAVIVECLTDNRNRTAGEVRHTFDKFGGNLGTSGCFSSAEIQKIFTSFADGAVMVMIHSNGVTEIVGMN